MDFEILSDSRAVGSFDLISPPLSPIGLIDAQQLLQVIKKHVQSGGKHLVVDCSGINAVYSDTLNALGQIGKVLLAHGGSLGVLTSAPTIVKSISSLGGLVKCYPDEPSMLSASVELMNAGAAPKPAAQPAPQPAPAVAPA
ncbi:MAG: hypothetical protein J6Z50_07665, partial [Fibrobacterales bacterium]|nr:hypothetical protein [Fibrobacterales bacterium]